jgi:hypothetical protein
MSTRLIVIAAYLDRAGSSHNCQYSKRHRISKGDQRLKIRNGRSWDHYCLPCARSIVDRSQQDLQSLATAIKEALGT